MDVEWREGSKVLMDEWWPHITAVVVWEVHKPADPLQVLVSSTAESLLTPYNIWKISLSYVEDISIMLKIEIQKVPITDSLW